MKRTLILFIAALFSLAACQTQKVDAEIIEISELNYTPEDSARLAKLDVALTKLSSSHFILTRPAKKVGKVKYKNVGNTDNSQHKSNNSEVKDKSVVKEKPKTKARDGAAIGEGNTVSQQKGIPPLLIYIGIGAVLLFLGWKLYRKK